MRWTKISPRENAGVTVLDVEGVMGPSNEDVLVATVTRAVEKGARKFVLNFEKEPHLDSGGLGEILRAYTASTRQGGSLVQANIHPRIKHLFEITKLTDVVISYDSEAQAVQALGGT
jgi:anti-sigma B factor antagonist